ncbi:efflux RND transporter permease subunit [Thermaurantimonas aggregans]|uniref:efflux RND transporter permease subunit n=1 Tax=Thermaurantimonas aggregans TaxID=2173829 RepID=UPI0023F473C3|nr:efflux RND transporter permease subunit [Thermaurantimonas aggregans]MCX8148856.1 efflux RND transporter permease subunit [Thermaurantimonas aggregans]
MSKKSKSLASISIDRPVLATVMSLVIILFGVISYTFLGVRELPSVDPPVVTVTTNYPGANAEVIESQITDPLEESINGISGIKSITSTSSDGRSTISVEFDLDVSLEDAANDVRDRVSRAIRRLPADCDPPVVVKSDANADPVISITVQSDQRNLLELTDIGINIFKERLQNIPGVSEINIWGEKRYSMKLTLDPLKMAYYNLTPQDIQQALNRENVEIPAGRVEGFRTELSVKTLGRLSSVEDFNNLIIAERNSRIIRFSDIGVAELRPENERSLLRGNGGQPMIGVAITPQPGVNVIELADRVYEKVEKIKKELPDDLVLGIALDSTVPVRKAIEEVQNTIIIAFLLVVLIIYLFLRNWRTTLIPIIAIPISLVGTFFVIYIFDYTINILTLLGIVLATGLVVDDAIVMMENIYSKIEKGVKPIKAAHKGASEIFFAILSTTVTLVAVFLPIVFLQGLTGKLFREFAIVVSGAVIISTFVSLTLTPMLSARLLKKRQNETAFFKKSEAFFLMLNRRYQYLLSKFLDKPAISIAGVVATVVITILAGRKVPTELAPLEDKSRLRIVATAPEGTSYEAMFDYMTELIELTDTLPEKEHLLCVTSPGFGASVSVNSGFVRLMLKDPKERKKSQQQLADELSALLQKYNFSRAFVAQDQTIGGNRFTNLPVQFVIQAPNFEKLKEALPKFIEMANASGKFQFVDVNLKFNKPEMNITINRERAATLGISVADVAQSLQLMFTGQRFGYFLMNNKQYQVIGQADRLYRDEPSDFEKVFVRNKRGELIPLSNVIEYRENAAPPILYRYNRYVSATVSANPAKGVSLGQGIEEMKRISREVLDDTFSYSLAGPSKEFEDSSGSLNFAFIFALLLVYLVLAAQFESFRDPLIIMLTVPLALAGAVLSLYLTGHTLNIFSQIGIIVLIGIVTKNGILIVEFANQKRDEGMALKRAVLEASVQRMRPILMTSLATILGAVPIAFALGGGATSRVPMGIVVIGGLLFSLLLTLFIIPSLYLILTRRKKHETT